MINTDVKSTEELLFLFALQGDRLLLTTMLQSITFSSQQLTKAYKIASRRGLKLTPNTIVRQDMVDDIDVIQEKYNKDNVSGNTLIEQGRKCTRCATLLYNHMTSQFIDDAVATRFAFMLCQINDPRLVDFNLLYNVYINYQFVNKQHKTFLHVASKHGHANLIAMLLEQYVVINAQDVIYKTALHYAVEFYHVDVIKQLLKHRCHVNLYDMYGYTPLHYVAPGPRVNINLFELLLKHGWYINKKSRDKKYKDCTLLSMAVQQRRCDVVVYLLKHHASPFVPSLSLKVSHRTIEFEKYYETPLECALRDTNDDDFNHI